MINVLHDFNLNNSFSCDRNFSVLDQFIFLLDSYPDCCIKMATAMSVTSDQSSSMQEFDPSVGVDTILMKGSTLDDELRGFMRKVWTTTKYSDFSLIARGRRFKVHKVFLSAHSSYFGHGPGDLSQDSGEVDLEPEVLELVLKFLYEGMVEVVKDVIPKLQDVADFLGAEILKKQCRFYSLCETELTPDNCLDVWESALAVGNKATSNQALQIALKNFDKSQHTSDFNQLPLPRILDLLPHPQLNVQSADERLGAAVNWVMCDSDARTEHLPVILDLLPLQAMSVWYLRQVMHSPGVKPSSAACAQIRAALDGSKGIPEPRAAQRESLTKQQLTPHLQAGTHQSHNTYFVTMGVQEYKDGKYQPASNKVWSVSLKDDMQVTLNGHLHAPHIPDIARLCSIGSDLYVGGLGQDRSQLWYYNLQTQTQRQVGR